MQALIESYGFSTKGYRDAESFLRIQHQSLDESDALIVDLGLPGKSGAALLQTIKGQGKGPLRLIISGAQTASLAKQLAGVQFDKLFRKPIGLEKVQELIALLPVRPERA